MATQQISISFSDAMTAGMGGCLGALWLAAGVTLPFELIKEIVYKQQCVPQSLLDRATKKEWYVSQDVADAIVKADSKWVPVRRVGVGSFVVDGTTGRTIMVEPGINRDGHPDRGLFPVSLTKPEAEKLGVEIEE